MFGQTNDNQQTGSAHTAQNPSMLDNVATQDLQPTAQQQATQPVTQPADPQAQASAQQHPITSDNPFAQTPVAQSVQPVDPPTTVAPVQPQDDQSSQTVPTTAPSEPAVAPAFEVTPVAGTEEDKVYTSVVPDSPVDHDKLAGMKQDAMSHLEPLVDHIDGTPEETFKTTMMMIQANDNHTLIDKALEAAKNITDDKERAEALLDIINEINYFSQATSQE